MKTQIVFDTTSPIFELVSDSELKRMNSIIRWSLENTIKSENDSEHSFWVSFFTLAIVEKYFPNDFEMKFKCLAHAVTHDVSEIFSGDIAHHVKRNNFNGIELKGAIDDYCNNGVQNKFKNFHILKAFEYEKDEIVKSVVKLGDWMSFIQYVENEISLGNKNLEKVHAYLRKSFIDEKCNFLNMIGVVGSCGFML